MSCLRFMGPPPLCDDKLSYSSPPKTWRKIARLIRMSMDESVEIRSAAAGNPMTPMNWLATLSTDPSERVRGWVARNPATPNWVLSVLSNDSSPMISAFAKNRLGVKNG